MRNKVLTAFEVVLWLYCGILVIAVLYVISQVDYNILASLWVFVLLIAAVPKFLGFFICMLIMWIIYRVVRKNEYDDDISAFTVIAFFAAAFIGIALPASEIVPFAMHYYSR